MAEKTPGWFAERLTVNDTGVIGPEVIQDERRSGMPEEMILQEYYCSFQAAIVGAYYGQAMTEAEEQKRIAGVPWDPIAPVHTIWDLGIGDSTSIWFAQLIGREVRLIDFYEASGVGLEHYVKLLNQKPYVYGDAVLPHDGKAKELGTGRTREETLGSMGVKNITVLPQHRLEDGINAARLLLPRCWFDAEKCKHGVEALRQYRRAWDEDRRTFTERPLHDWTSHAADAFRYLAMSPTVYREPTPDWVRKNRARSRSPMAG